MSIQEIETAIANLSPEELGRLAVWFDHFMADQWDAQIKEDAQAGRLDPLLEEADREFQAGRCKPM